MAVFGRGPNTTVFGALKWAMLSRHHPIRSSGVVPSSSGVRVTNAQTASPQVSSGLATTAASITWGCRYSTSSTSRLEIFSPPEMIMSFDRSLISIYPSGCITARSPVCSQPPSNASAVAVGFFR